MDDAASRCNIEIELEEYTAPETKTIKDAHQFSAASSTLFAQVAASVACQEDHLAHPPFLGFQSRLTGIFMCKCKDRTWKPEF